MPRARFVLASIALVLLIVGGATAADPTYVPFGPYNSVTLQPTYAGVVSLTVKAQRWGYGTYEGQNYLGQTAFAVGHDGHIVVNAITDDFGNENPRLRLQSFGYDDSNHPDTLQVNIGGSTVASVSSGGAFERYNTYGRDDNPAFAVESYDDKLYGGISNAGGLITAQNHAPAASSIANGEARLWFDPTPSTGGIMVTSKDSAGTLKTVKLG